VRTGGITTLAGRDTPTHLPNARRRAIPFRLWCRRRAIGSDQRSRSIHRQLAPEANPPVFVARPDPSIAVIVEEKSGKGFRPCDELWLIIQGSTRIPKCFWGEDFEAVPNLDAYVFSRVFVLAATGAAFQCPSCPMRVIRRHTIYLTM
jgi:hypothetical protein